MAGSTFCVTWKVLVTMIEDDSIFIVGSFTNKSVYQDSAHIYNGGCSVIKIVFV